MIFVLKHTFWQLRGIPSWQNDFLWCWGYSEIMFAHIRTVFAHVCSRLLMFARFLINFCSKNTHFGSLELSEWLSVAPGLLRDHVCSHTDRVCLHSLMFAHQRKFLGGILKTVKLAKKTEESLGKASRVSQTSLWVFLATPRYVLW